MAKVESNIFQMGVGNQDLILKTQAEKKQQFLDASTKQEAEHLKELTKIHEKHLNELARLEEQKKKAVGAAAQKDIESKINEEKEAAEKVNKDKLAAYEKLVNAQKQYQEKATKYAQQVELNSYRAMTAKQKFEYQKNLRDELTLQKKTIDDKLAATRAALKAETDETKKAALKQDIADLESQRGETTGQLNVAKSRVSKLGRLPQNKAAAREDLQKALKADGERVRAAKVDVQAAKEKLAGNKELLKLEKDLRNAEKNAKQARGKEDKEKAKQAAEDAKKRLQEARDNSEEYQELVRAENELKEAGAETFKDTMKDALNEAGDAVSRLGSNVMKNVSNSIEDNLDAMFGSQGKMMGRLQGSAIDWAETVDEVSDTIGFSGVVNKKSVVAKMVELVDSGVAYNLEMRAFLAETSQNIAATFDATNGTLLRLIRIQQADTTAARLGMEAVLTKTLNQMFEDTAYLADKVSDSVSGAIIDLAATTSRDNAVELEFTLQKWLGALYSLGLSSDAVNKIAQGFNYLGTGNITGFTNDSAINTLFTMSATRLNDAKSLDQMFNYGLTSNDTNKLLRSMVELLSEIAESQETYVTKSAFADLFGMSLTDLNTFTSLTNKEINSLFELTASYDSLYNETESQLSQVSKRISFSKLVDTAIDNALVGAASTIGSNGVTYGTWKTLSLLKDYVGEIKVPGIIALGSGISSGLDLLNIAQTAVVGLGLLGSLLGGLDSMMSGGPTVLSNWNFKETTSRGNTLSILDFGDSFSSTSYSAKIGVGSKSAKDVEAVSLQSGKNDALESAGTTDEELEQQKEIPQKIYDALAGDDTPNILSVLQEIDDRLDPGRVFYTAITGMLSSDAVSQVTNLSTQLADVKSTMYTSGVTNTITTNNPYTSHLSNGYGYNGTLTNANGQEQHSIGLETIIATAVETALRNIAGYSSGTGLPVTITNSSGYGG